ncbi:hypothetical protein CALCODRAFT_228857 [Calocera cornea HHB12733]|uniref:Uncharacterized protein n=1 Tax=Calocera cornea HHB12733 TaxID=1353952 RepID=A0A165H3L8_9BASI|nr:hypothetical protein CALCODRAFT_228857 [Calocera cornea HHB12733]
MTWPTHLDNTHAVPDPIREITNSPVAPRLDRPPKHSGYPPHNHKTIPLFCIRLARPDPTPLGLHAIVPSFPLRHPHVLDPIPCLHYVQPISVHLPWAPKPQSHTKNRSSSNIQFHITITLSLVFSHFYAPIDLLLPSVISALVALLCPCCLTNPRKDSPT